ncbi:MAG: TVP38/TMEM64 family protein [Candidatus Nanoarchaeia archaeon]
MPNKSTQKFLFGVSIFLFFLILILVSYQYLTFEHLIEYKEILKEFALHNFLLSILLFIIIVTIITNLPIPLSAVSKIFSGFIFGFWLGTLLNIIATFLSAMVGFYFSRYLFKSYFQRKFKSYLEKINPEIKSFGFNYFLSMRLFLVFPYFLINILGGITAISQKKYALTSLLGVIPASFLYAYGGLQINLISSPKDIISTEILLLFITLSILPLMHALLQHTSIQRRLHIRK